MTTGADRIVQMLEFHGIKEAFMVTGGGAMFLNDAFAKSSSINTTFNLHEQASAMAAVGYTKVTGLPSVVVPTTGCGGTNAITGLLDAWQDSEPVIFISGNVKRTELTREHKRGKLRKKGVQELDIISVVNTMTKWSYQLKSIEEICDVVTKAIRIATEGRPGPVWLDVPMDIQSGDISQIPLQVSEDKEKNVSVNLRHIEEDRLNYFCTLIAEAKRPLILAGYGIHLSKTKSQFLEFIRKNNLPVVTTYLGIDLFRAEDKNFIGKLGTKGDRAGNFAVNNCDLLIVLGSSVNITVTGFQYEHFARKAKIVVVDIDKEEHSKENIRIDLFLNIDLRYFFKYEINSFKVDENWLKKLASWKRMWPVILSNYSDTSNGVNMYHALDVVNQNAPDDSIFVSDAGSAYYVTSQSIKLRGMQRYITSGAQADMGFTIPASIGASLSGQPVIGFTGDGSFAMNMQELAVIKGLNLNVKIVVLNNYGYLSIKNTMNRFFNSRYFGVNEESGLFLPQIGRTAKAFRLNHFVYSENTLASIQELRKVLNSTGPAIIEFDCMVDQEIIPTSSTKRLEDGTLLSPPLHDMYPFLGEEVVSKEMINN